MSEQILVNREALCRLMSAINGPDYYIRELQATRGIDPENPINVLERDIIANVQKEHMENQFGNKTKENKEDELLSISEITDEYWNSLDNVEKQKYLDEFFKLIDLFGEWSSFASKKFVKTINVLFAMQAEKSFNMDYHIYGDPNYLVSMAHRLIDNIVKDMEEKKTY